MPLELNEFAYLTLEEVKEWLKIKADDTRFDQKLTRLINTACSRVESFIDGPVLTREYTDYTDGNNSNVIIPHFWPITEIVSLKIDFNRQFGAVQGVDAENFVLRGFPPINYPLVSPTITVNGTDIVLRDDSNVAVLGRIFAGSVIQSIELIYKAGRGEDAAALPADLVTATLLLVEYLYQVTENRELGVGSKGSFGQSYSRKQLGESGMPEEIEAMLMEYKDAALPSVAMPQRNNFRL